MGLCLGITNPTALLGKGDVIQHWACQVIAFSESSHTRRAVRALGSEFRRFGFSLSLSAFVPDKFEVSNPAGSFRGLSRGVAVASRFPIFSPRPSIVPPIGWASQRLLYSVVQVAQVPLHLVTVYLFPCAPPGSEKYRLNCNVLGWAQVLLESIHGPACLCGDLNSPLENFDVCRHLLASGWSDLALMAENLFECPVGPTCKAATRHTFGVGNADLSRFLTGAAIKYEFDLDAHSVQTLEFDFPTYNVPVWKWFLPSAFDSFEVDKVGLKESAAAVAGPLSIKLDALLDENNVDEALKVWSSTTERHISEFCKDDNGWCPRGKRFFGRSADVAPRKSLLAAPRFKFGRNGDFCVSDPSTALPVRQVQKQARRLQALCRLLSAMFFGPVQRGKALELWGAIMRSSGFGTSFAAWILDRLGLELGGFPPVEEIYMLLIEVQRHAKSLAQSHWRQKKVRFSLHLDGSMRYQGGRVPFALLREQQLPPVRELSISIEVKLSPQRWSPVGKSWIGVRNTQDFAAGDVLFTDDLRVVVQTVLEGKLQVDHLLSRRQAASLHKDFVTANPDVWCPNFLEKWDSFWKRDDEDTPRDFEPYLNLLPHFPEKALPSLTIDDWKVALRSAKASSMRGIDGWGIKELRLVPDCLIKLLLKLYSFIEQGGKWPAQLTHWMLIVLRKSDVQPADWTTLRPISVAGMLYRLWSRMRTKQFLQHCYTFKVPLVAPNLSTRAIWYFLADKLDCDYGAGLRPCGVVLDIIKCFNTVQRAMIKAALYRLGFDRQIVDAWMRALGQLNRTVLIDSHVYGNSSSTTGLPEGDPLSIVGMYCLTFWFRAFVLDVAPASLPVGYADNWEALFPNVFELRNFLPALSDFLDALRLPVNPGKCWAWSLDPEQRNVLRGLQWREQTLPLKLQARELGADISYCLKKAARVRNSRVQSAHQRLLRLGGLSLPRPFKQRLLLAGIWPHALHAAETAEVPKTVFGRLRTQATLALGLRKKGTNPMLACMLACPLVIDPQYVLLCNRVALFRQVLRGLPEYKDLFIGQLAGVPCRYRGPTRLMVRVLNSLGWTSANGATFVDESGRSFHLFMSSFRHIKYLLSTSWASHVCTQVCHRKGLTDLATVDLVVTKDLSSLRKEEKGMVLNQQVGSFFTEDYRHHCGGVTNCPLCGMQDSRAHRLEQCLSVAHIRQLFPDLMATWSTLPEHERYFGIFGEPASMRAWHARLDQIRWPSFVRHDSPEITMVYTDGSCLFPRWSHIRLAAYAAVVPQSDGGFVNLAHGLLPGSCHTAYRAEIMAACSAVHSFRRPIVTLDCKGVVDTGNSILRDLCQGVEPTLPSENTDLWAFFLEGARGTIFADARLRWVRGHMNWRTCVGPDKVDAWFNHWADRAANAPLFWCSRFCLPFRELIREFRALRQRATRIHLLHAKIGLHFSSVKSSSAPTEVIAVPQWYGYGVPQMCGFVDVHACGVCHLGFARKLLQWLGSLTFYERSSCGVRTDTSWLELFWLFLHTTSLIPPVAVEGSWRTVDDDENLLFVLPPFRVLFRTWKRILDGLVRGGLSLPVGPLVARVNSIGLFGGRFPCPGFGGFVPLVSEAADGLAVQLSEASCLRDLRIPFFN